MEPFPVNALFLWWVVFVRSGRNELENKTGWMLQGDCFVWYGVRGHSARSANRKRSLDTRRDQKGPGAAGAGFSG